VHIVCLRWKSGVTKMKTMNMFREKNGKAFSRLLVLFLAHTLMVYGVTFALPQEGAPEAASIEAVTDPANIVIPASTGLSWPDRAPTAASL